MPKYRVTAWQNDWTITVEGEDEDDAVDNAHTQLAQDAVNRLSDATWEAVLVDD
jgi:hypothetical protein